MSIGNPSPALRLVHQIVDAERAQALDDQQLLERFVAVKDPLAFAALVQRYGPMVLGVCRRILGGVHDAEDAFQATFLVLVRKAGALCRRDLLGPWLHAVALRTATKARAAACKRRTRENRAD